MDILSSRGNLTEEARYRELRGFSFARRTNSTYNKKPFKLAGYFPVLCDNLPFDPFTAPTRIFPVNVVLPSIKFQRRVFRQLSSHPVYIHPRFNYFFGFSGDSFYAILLSDAFCHPTDLCRSWRMAVQFSAWIAVLVALCLCARVCVRAF